MWNKGTTLGPAETLLTWGKMVGKEDNNNSCMPVSDSVIAVHLTWTGGLDTCKSSGNVVSSSETVDSYELEMIYPRRCWECSFSILLTQ
jgi:hypothetical protein